MENNREKNKATLSENLEMMLDSSVKSDLYDQMRIIESELQNQELNTTQRSSMLADNAYENFYYACPIACLTLNTLGFIEKANPAAEKLLLSSFKKLVNQKFEQFIDSQDKEDYQQFIQEIILLQHTELCLVVRLNITNSFTHNSVFQGLNYYEFRPESCLSNDGYTYVECHGYVISTNSTETKIVLSLPEVTKHVWSHETTGYFNEILEPLSDKQSLSIFEYNKELLNKIAEFKLYKRQAIEREALLDAIFNCSSDGIITVNSLSQIIFANLTTEHIFGYKKETLMKLGLNDIIPVKNNKFFEQIINNSSNNRIHSEGLGRHKDGFTIPLEISITKFVRNEINFLTIIVRDLTEHKRRDKREQEHLDELAHITRLNLMGEMVSGIAHEVNQPLTAVANYLQACLNIINNEFYSKEKLIEILKKTHEQVLKAGQIIHRMRDFINNKKLQSSSADINKLINDAIGLCEPSLKQNSILLKLELKDNLPTLMIDSIQIEQVILNLIRNSIDALVSSPLLPQKRLSIQTKIKTKDSIEIRIKDNGPGIGKEVQEKIFTPFYTSKENGMGLGLSICRSILDAHNGILYFNSLPGKGSTFYLSLPVPNDNNESNKFN